MGSIHFSVLLLGIHWCIATPLDASTAAVRSGCLAGLAGFAGLGPGCFADELGKCRLGRKEWETRVNHLRKNRAVETYNCPGWLVGWLIDWLVCFRDLSRFLGKSVAAHSKETYQPTIYNTMRLGQGYFECLKRDWNAQLWWSNVVNPNMNDPRNYLFEA